MEIKSLRRDSPHSQLFQELTIDCSRCSGLCCTALYFSKAEGFPYNKAAGMPCKNLQSDFRCSVHSSLANRGHKGCAAFDCFGAGQMVTQQIYAGKTWRDRPDRAQEQFEAFSAVRQLNQMLWYLAEAASLAPAQALMPSIDLLIEQNQQIKRLPPSGLLSADLEAYRAQVNQVLKQAIQLVSSALGQSPSAGSQSASIGKNFSGQNLTGRDFSMSLLIASNFSKCSLEGTIFLGADLRDANFNGADLRQSLFLTQFQINAAKGNKETKLPETLARPASWKK